MFTNLLINAYEAMDGKGRVDDHAPARRGSTTAATAAKRCWSSCRTTARACRRTWPSASSNPFFTTKAQGSGLGLAIVRKIVDAHDGRIDLRTAPGSGTPIRVTLPVSAQDAA